MQERHQPRRRDAPSTMFSRRDRSRSPRNGTPHEDSRRSRSPIHRRSPTPEEPRQRKRPGGGSRMGASRGADVLRRQEEREREQEMDALRQSTQRGGLDYVRNHYNAVPQRGREWRKTDSKIKGLRSFNNWVKSTLIQKFSPSEEFVAQHNDSKDWAEDSMGPPMSEVKPLLVLDMGCGKGGDLGKWAQTPQPVELYVGLDPANVSIEQARDRYSQMLRQRGRRPQFHGEFFTKDCFGEFLGDVPIVQQVGIDPNAGPGGSMMASRWGGGGFDVVTSMFAIHYAFETEEKARQMLSNVAGCLKKGGRFIAVCPNSDVIASKVSAWHKQRKEREAAKAAETEAPEDGEVEEDDRTEWGNEIYRVRFPGKTPEDGIFRPPFGWKYTYFMQEAVEEVPEFVVPWEAFRALTEDYNLELQYRKPFLDIWEEEKDDRELGPLSERMGVRNRATGELNMTEEEKDAVTLTMPSTIPPRNRTLSRPTPRAAEIPDLPEYEPPEAPLTAESHRQLLMLMESQLSRQLKTHLQHAAEKLTDSAGDVNEKLSDARVRYERAKEKRRGATDSEKVDIEQDNENEEYQRLAEMERKVDDGLKDAMETLNQEVTEAQRAALGVRQTRGQRRRQREAASDDEDAEDEDDGDYEGTPERETREANAQNPPSHRLCNALDEGTEKWNSQSLTARYAGNNNYIGFYRIVHDSKFPGDEVPPPPNASTWFSHLEDPNANADTAGSPSNRRTRNRREPSPADSDDIAIERERISLKCPLTLQPFRDPVTSTKCPHSFEREAIQDMISRSSLQIPPPPGRAGRRIRAVKCPVCSVPLCNDDLRSDPVLLRKVRRAEELLARQADDELEGSQSQQDHLGPVTLASDAIDADEMDVDVDVDEDEEVDEDMKVRVKSEPIPTQNNGDTDESSEESESE
ncbi:mRNA cap guanine-N7 methyltransferase [Penicillium maclennaniae]|uniref:mRNA cap guanine-N7 methyltransferase n=1 Tax=Penicillium maclennaniae TaxID=1343394 RepID=UPI00254269F7|nr:mRNA cap guanine-N7 methyltransferase [Penicillium maclennaniae]KAJ5662036.1 mRNA cap guanine-N7 methyltransferase [Penicillium maclennaniae]